MYLNDVLCIDAESNRMAHHMRTAPTLVEEVKSKKVGSGLSDLSRVILKASYRKSNLSPQAKAKARSEAFASLMDSLAPKKR